MTAKDRGLLPIVTQNWHAGVVALLLLAGCAATPQIPQPKDVLIAPPTEAITTAPIATKASTPALPRPPDIQTPLAPPGKMPSIAPKIMATMPADNAVPAAPSKATAPSTANGSAAFYVPNKMVEKSTSIVHLRIDPKMPVEELQQELAKQLNLDFSKIKKLLGKDAVGTPSKAGEIQGLTQVQVGDKMEAQLAGNESDFEVSPNGATPGILVGNTWQWQWQVTPKHASVAGPFILTISAWDASRKAPFPSINEPVIVEAVPPPPTNPIDQMIAWLKTIEDLYTALAAVAGILATLAVTFRKYLRQMLRPTKKTQHLDQ